MSIPELYQIFLNHPKVCTDTRKITPNCIFFALKGDNFNGNKFAKDALKNGASVAIIDEKEYALNDSYIPVSNALVALQQLAEHHRKALNIPIIGITGSNGKTTSKELIYSVLSQKLKVFATEGNFNNHIGVPLSLLSINKEHQLGIIEMGANKPGDIKELCEIAHPNYGFITNIGKAHLEGMGGLEGVLNTKCELYDYLRQRQGKVFVNTSHDKLRERSSDIHSVYFGINGDEEVVGNLLQSLPNVKLSWTKRGHDKKIDTVKSNLPGSYNFENILAAICIGDYFGLNPEEIKKGIESYVPSNNRSQVLEKGSNTFIMDAYNANPSSMKLAIQNFSDYSGENKVVILGEMLEVGKNTLEEHEQVLVQAQEAGFEKVFLTGTAFKQLKRKFPNFTFFTHTGELLKHLKRNLIESSTFLVKGSRSNQLEKVLDIF